jgi:DNA-binding transcriptional LysR family regulator
MELRHLRYFVSVAEALSFTKAAQKLHTMIHAVAAGLGVALVPEQLKELEHEKVVFRPLDSAVATEGCIAWRNEDPSAALKGFVQMVEQVGRSVR